MLAPWWTGVSGRPDVLDRWPLARCGRAVQAAAGFVPLGRCPGVWAVGRTGLEQRAGHWAVGSARHGARGAIGRRFRAGAGIRQRLRGGQAVDARLAQAARTPAPESAPTA